MSVCRNSQVFLSAKLLFIFFSYIYAAVTNLSMNLENDDEMICIPNATFHIDCNRCKCSPTGMSIDCTNWSCTTLQIPYDLLLNVTVNCRGGEIFLYNWYKCLCAKSSSMATCSSAHRELAYNLRPKSGSIISLADSRVSCTPGIVFKNECDTCICHQSGADAACLGISCVTLNGRPEAYCNHEKDISQKLCVPHSTFSIDCNQCICSNDGYSFLCDSFPCLGVEVRHDQMLNITFRCEARSSFLYNQYECLCSRNGKYALCSLAHYDKTKEFLESNKKVFSIAEFPDLCTPGMTFKDECNICICGSNEKAACTKIDCDLSFKYSSSATNSSALARIIPNEEIWIQRAKKNRFCKRHYGALYCRFLRNYN